MLGQFTMTNIYKFDTNYAFFNEGFDKETYKFCNFRTFNYYFFRKCQKYS